MLKLYYRIKIDTAIRKTDTRGATAPHRKNQTQNTQDNTFLKQNTKQRINQKKERVDIMRQIDKYKHNYKLQSQDIAEIMTEYLLDKSTSNVERLIKKYNISRSRFYQVVRDKRNKELLEESIKKNRQNFTKKCDAIINKALQRLNQELENPDVDININQLTTTLGILYDKSRLEDGLSTSNQAIQINIQVDK